MIDGDTIRKGIINLNSSNSSDYRMMPMLNKEGILINRHAVVSLYHSNRIFHGNEGGILDKMRYIAFRDKLNLGANRFSKQNYYSVLVNNEIKFIKFGKTLHDKLLPYDLTDNNTNKILHVSGQLRNYEFMDYSMSTVSDDNYSIKFNNKDDLKNFINKKQLFFIDDIFSRDLSIIKDKFGKLYSEAVALERAEKLDKILI